MSWSDHRPTFSFKLAGDQPARIEHILVPIVEGIEEDADFSLAVRPKLLDLDAEDAEKSVFDLILHDMRGGRYSKTNSGIVRNPKTLLCDLSRTSSDETVTQTTARLNELTAHITGESDAGDIRDTIAKFDPDDYAKFLLDMQRQAYYPQDGKEPMYQSNGLWAQNPISVLLCEPQILVHETDFDGIKFGDVEFVLFPKFLNAQKVEQEAPAENTAQPTLVAERLALAVTPAWA